MQVSQPKKDRIPLREHTIGEHILFVRSRKVMLDRDLAALYGIQTFRLNEAVKRNVRRFPEDFMFRLTKKEKEGVIANCDNLRVLKFSPQLPFAFTEQGVCRTRVSMPWVPSCEVLTPRQEGNVIKRAR